ncbi:hypothetical protein OY671_010282, partial [Metschnikowia pulcherrima]
VDRYPVIDAVEIDARQIVRAGFGADADEAIADREDRRNSRPQIQRGGQGPAVANHPGSRKGEAGGAFAGISAQKAEETAGNAGGAAAARAGWFVTFASCLGYATFAILSNSVGTAILQSTGYFHV